MLVLFGCGSASAASHGKTDKMVIRKTRMGMMVLRMKSAASSPYDDHNSNLF